LPVEEPVSTFDIELGGQAVLDRARSCFSEARLRRPLQLGVSLRYSNEDGASKKSYFPGDGKLRPGERRCLEKQLLGLTAGAPPDHSTIVTYSIWITPDGGRTKARVAR
jgi:hypothetical protein